MDDRVRLADRKSELAEPGRLVPVAALELDLPFHHTEEARSAESESATGGRLPTERASPRASPRPFEGDPLSVLEDLHAFFRAFPDSFTKVEGVLVVTVAAVADDHASQVHAFLGEDGLLRLAVRPAAHVCVEMGTPVAFWARAPARRMFSITGVTPWWRT